MLKKIILLVFIGFLTAGCSQQAGREELAVSDIKTMIGQKPYTLIYFWTTWCGPCRKTLSQTLPVVERSLDTSKVQLLVVAVSSDDEAVNKIRDNADLKTPNYKLRFNGPDIWLNHKMALKNALHELFPGRQVWNNGVPVFVLADDKGNVINKKLPSDLQKLFALLDTAGAGLMKAKQANSNDPVSLTSEFEKKL